MGRISDAEMERRSNYRSGHVVADFRVGQRVLVESRGGIVATVVGVFYPTAVSANDEPLVFVHNDERSATWEHMCHRAHQLRIVTEKEWREGTPGYSVPAGRWLKVSADELVANYRSFEGGRLTRDISDDFTRDW